MEVRQDQFQKAICIRSISRDAFIDYERAFALASNAGFTGIELACDLSGSLSITTPPEKIDEIRDLAERSKLSLPTLLGGASWKKNILSVEKREREEAKNIIHQLLGVAHQLGSSVLLVCPGIIGPFLSGPPQVDDYEAAYIQAISDYKELANYAEELKVIIGIENVWTRFLTSALEMRDFVDKIGSPFVGVYFDVGNVIRTGYPQHWIRILGNRIKALHFKDFKCDIGNMDGFVELLEGDVDFKSVMNSLREIHYHGWVTVEQTPPAHFPEDMVYRASKSLDIILY